MVLQWFDKSKKGEPVSSSWPGRTTPARSTLIKLALRKRRRDERLRIQLADVLIMAGRKKEAIRDLQLAGRRPGPGRASPARRSRC